MNVTAVLLAAAVAPAPGFFDAGIGRFLVSPGFGGAAALLGGVLAYLGARRQSRDTRERDRQDRWWSTLTWVYDRATTERDEARLPAPMALEMFDRLSEVGRDVLEFQIIDGLQGLFPDSSDDDQDPSAGGRQGP